MTANVRRGETSETIVLRGWIVTSSSMSGMAARIASSTGRSAGRSAYWASTRPAASAVRKSLVTKPPPGGKLPRPAEPVGHRREETLRPAVRRIEDSSHHPAGEKHFVGVADQPVRLGVAHSSLDECRILAGISDRHQPALAVHQVRADDHTVPVVLEALRGIDAADLAEAAVECGPQRAGQRSAD